jgi:hypothetical protein
MHDETQAGWGGPICSILPAFEHLAYWTRDRDAPSSDLATLPLAYTTLP